MFDKMKQLMEMKKQADKIKKELDAEIMEVSEVSGIKIVINGSQNFQTIEIEDRYLTAESKKRLETDLLRSVNGAIRRSQAAAAKKMQQMAGLDIPGLKF